MADFENENGSNDSNNETFQDVLEARLSRRGFLGSSLTAAAGLSLAGAGAVLEAVPASAHGRTSRGPLLGFQGIEVSKADTVVVPRGYTAEVLVAWGDPVGTGPDFAQDGSNSADDQARQWAGASILSTMAFSTSQSSGTTARVSGFLSPLTTRH